MGDKTLSDAEFQKQTIYEAMTPRRRKFIDRIGYDKWDPFQEPKDPVEIRTDPTRRTTQDLVSQFLRDRPAHKSYDSAYASGAMELALGMINKQDRFRGMFEFSIWYNALLKKEGVSYDDD